MTLVHRRRTRASQGLMLALAISLSGFSTHGDAQQFGRFFTTPEERKHLEKLRKTGLDTGKTVAAENADPAAKSLKAIDFITLKGVIYRQDKTGVAWVNESAVQEGNPSLDYLKLEEGQILDNKVIIELPRTGQPVKLKVGQSYSPQSGTVFDLTEKSP